MADNSFFYYDNKTKYIYFNMGVGVGGVVRVVGVVGVGSLG